MLAETNQRLPCGTYPICQCPSAHHEAPLDPIAEVPIEASVPEVREEPKFEMYQAIRSFQTDFERDITKGVARLMIEYPTRYCQILGQMNHYFSQENFPAKIFWSMLLMAFRTLSEDQRALAGGDILQNEDVTYFVMDYMRYRTLLENKGVCTSIESVQAALGKPDLNIDLNQRYNGSQFDGMIIDMCLPNDACSNLSIKASTKYLMDFFANLSAYSARNCAIILAKFAKAFAKAKHLNMILAIADSPFYEALRHMKDMPEVQHAPAELDQPQSGYLLGKRTYLCASPVPKI